MILWRYGVGATSVNRPLGVCLELCESEIGGLFDLRMLASGLCAQRGEL